jgi:large subunit ribosomal protein L20
MARVKRSKIRRTRIKRIFKQAKGFRGARSKLLRTAINAVTKAQQYAYRDRRNRKRDFRRLWIARINAAARLNGTSYAALMGKLKKADIQVNRKMLSEIAIADPAAFTAIVQAVG